MDCLLFYLTMYATFLYCELRRCCSEDVILIKEAILNLCMYVCHLKYSKGHFSVLY